MSDMITLAFVCYGIGAILSAVLFMRMANRGEGLLALSLAALWPVIFTVIALKSFGLIGKGI